MPPRIQRLRMRLLRFDFTISHVPGQELTTADALSRAPSKSTSPVKQEEEIELYVENILLQLSASDERLEEIAAAQKEDPIYRKLFEYCKEGWPDMIQKLPSSLSPHWSSRGEISQEQRLLVRDPRLIIPSSMRLEILDRIHDGHQGIVKCTRRTKDSRKGYVALATHGRVALILRMNGSERPHIHCRAINIFISHDLLPSDLVAQSVEQR